MPIRDSLKGSSETLRIVHVLRAPVGGLFRHVRDLAREQAERGHEVGIVVDSRASDSLTGTRLAALEKTLALGLHRVAMCRDIGPGDVGAYLSVRAFAADRDVDVLHGHGAKGGAYARLAARSLRADRRVVGFYTPHGGSLHFSPASLKGQIFSRLERALARRSDGIIFESAFAARAFAKVIGPHGAATRVIPNGLADAEFMPAVPGPDAAEFVFLGELRQLKGVDLLIEALARVRRVRPARLVIVGEGPDRALFEREVGRQGLAAAVTFTGALPVAEAFRLGRILVMPSRAESLPYVALEAAAARVPLIATEVGGLPEIVAGSDTPLVPPGDAAALATRMDAALTDLEATAERAERLARVVAQRFDVKAMAEAVLAFYGERLAALQAAREPIAAPSLAKA